MKRWIFAANVKTRDETITLQSPNSHACKLHWYSSRSFFCPNSCCESPYQKRAAPPRPPMVTSISPSSFKSISPCTDWPKNFTFSPSPPDAIRCEMCKKVNAVLFEGFYNSQDAFDAVRWGLGSLTALNFHYNTPKTVTMVMNTL